MPAREKCMAGSDYYARPVAGRRCPTPVVDGSIYCAEHRIEAFARVPSLAEKLNALVSDVVASELESLEREIDEKRV